MTVNRSRRCKERYLNEIVNQTCRLIWQLHLLEWLGSKLKYTHLLCYNILCFKLEFFFHIILLTYNHYISKQIALLFYTLHGNRLIGIRYDQTSFYFLSHEAAFFQGNSKQFLTHLNTRGRGSLDVFIYAFLKNKLM